MVLSIQCGRGITKIVENKMKGIESPGVKESTQSYIHDFDPFGEYSPPPFDKRIDFSDVDTLLSMFKQRCYDAR